MLLICHVTSYGHVFQGLYDFMGGGSLAMVSLHLAVFGVYGSKASGNI